MPTFFILICIVTVICGQLLLKSGMTKFGRITTLNVKQVLPTFLKILVQKKIIAGFFLYGISSILWIYILSIVDLSFAFPFLSIAYVGVPMAASLFLKEKVCKTQWIGITIVVAGVILVALS